MKIKIKKSLSILIFFIIIGLASAIYSNYININGSANVGVSPDIVGWWPFNEGSGQDADDFSMYNNDGILGNSTPGDDAEPAWTSSDCKSGNCLIFDGVNDYVDAGNGASLDITNAITIEAWVKMQGWNNYPGILAKGYATTGGYSLHVRDDYSLWFELDETDGTRHYYNPTEIKLTLDSLYHVAATYDGSTQRVYINGQEVGTGLSGTFTIGTVSDSVEVGHLPGWGYFNGIIDNPRIWNVALTSAQVHEIYERGI